MVETVRDWSLKAGRGKRRGIVTVNSLQDGATPRLAVIMGRPHPGGGTSDEAPSPPGRVRRRRRSPRVQRPGRRRPSCWSTPRSRPTSSRPTAGFYRAEPDIDQVGARLDRRHHRQAARREGQPAGRRDLGVAASTWRCSSKEGMLRRTRRSTSTRSTLKYRDRKQAAAWVGMDVCGATVCFNTVEAKKRNLPKPRAGRTSPSRSTRARSSCPTRPPRHRLLRRDRVAHASWASKGWAYMDQLHENIASTRTRAPSPATRPAPANS